MADQSARFEILLDFMTDGSQRTSSELRGMQELINRLATGGKVASKELRDLGTAAGLSKKQIGDLATALKTVEGAVKLTTAEVGKLTTAQNNLSNSKVTKEIDGQTEAYRKLVSALSDAQEKFRQLNQEDTGLGGSGTGEGVVDNWSEKELRDFQRTEAAKTTTLGQAVDQRLKLIDKEHAAREKNEQQAQKNRQDATRVQGLDTNAAPDTVYDKQTQAVEQLAKAKKELTNANAAVKRSEGSGDEARIAANLQRQEAAIHGVEAAKKSLRGSNQAVVASEQKLADAAERTALAFSKDESDAHRINDAKNARALADAERDVASAKERVAKAQSRVDAEQARIYEAEAKSARELATAEEELAKAQEQVTFTKSTKGLSEQKVATEKLERANKELSDSEREVNRLRSSGGSNSEITTALNRQTAATKELNRAQESANRSSQEYRASQEATRYALYDVASTTGIAAAAIIAAGVGVTSVFAEWEQGIANVARTTDQDIGSAGLMQLEQQLQSLATQIPVTTEEITAMASRAGQIGVATEDIYEFTNALSKFVAISDTLNADEAAEYIARISNLTGFKDYERLADIIARVGVNSAATDQQIAKTAQELAQATAAANFTADEIIGLSAAFASLGIPAERSRSVINDLVVTMESGIAGLNDTLPVFSSLIGKTAEETAELWRQNPTEFLTLFSQGIANSGRAVEALNAVGLEGQRALPAFAAIAKDVNKGAEFSVLTNALKDAREEMATGGEVASQFGKIVGTLQSQWQLLVNSLGVSAQLMGGELSPVLKDIVGTLALLVQGFNEFAATADGQETILLIGKVAAVAAGFLGLVAVLATAGASVFAFKTALSSFPALQILIRNLLGIRTAGFAAAIGINATTIASGRMATATAIAAAGARGLATALIWATRATLILGAIAFVIQLLTDFNGAMITAGNVAIGLGSTVINVGSWIAQGIAHGVNGAIHALNWLFRAINSFTGLSIGDIGLVPVIDIAQQAFREIKGLESAVGGWQEQFRTVDPMAEALENVNAQLGDMSTYTDAAGDLGAALGNGPGGAGKGAKDLGKSVKDAAKELRTLTDYADDLSGVFTRAFELRFGRQTSIDAIASQLETIRDAADEARTRVSDLRQELRQLNADLGTLQSDLSIQKYFLSVAIEYGDDERAAAIRAKIAELEADMADKRSDLADKSGDLADAEADANASLEGNTQAARDQRASMLELVTAYQEHLRVLAASGASEAELADAAAQLKRDFMAQGLALGYSSDELSIYAAAFDDWRKIVAKMPRNVTVEFDGDPASTAMKEFFARAEADAAQAGADMAGALSDAFGGGLGGLGGLGGGGFPGLPMPETPQTSRGPSKKPTDLELKTPNDGSRIVLPGEINIYDPEFGTFEGGGGEFDTGKRAPSEAWQGLDGSRPIPGLGSLSSLGLSLLPLLFPNGPGNEGKRGGKSYGEGLAKGIESVKPGNALEKELDVPGKWGKSGSSSGGSYGIGVKKGYLAEEIPAFFETYMDPEDPKGRGNLTGVAYGSGIKVGFDTEKVPTNVGKAFDIPSANPKGRDLGVKFGTGIKEGVASTNPPGDPFKISTSKEDGLVVGFEFGTGVKTGLVNAKTGTGAVDGLKGAAWNAGGGTSGALFGTGVKTGFANAKTGTGAVDSLKGAAWSSSGSTSGANFGAGVKTGFADANVVTSLKNSTTSGWDAPGRTSGGGFGKSFKTGFTDENVSSSIKVGFDTGWTTSGSSSGGTYATGFKTGFSNAKIVDGVKGSLEGGWVIAGKDSGGFYGTGVKQGYDLQDPGGYVRGKAANTYAWKSSGSGLGVQLGLGVKSGYDLQDPAEAIRKNAANVYKWKTAGSGLGAELGRGVDSGYRLVDPGAIIRANAGNVYRWKLEGTGLGAELARGVKSGYSGQGPGSYTRSALGTKQNYKDSGYTAGWNFASGFKSGFNDNTGKVSVSGGGKVGLGSAAFYDGGYTGSGGKYQTAGIVHKGEYVIPKHLVNQRTGLPHADALGRLPQGSQASSSYASGGYARGGNGMMVTELAPQDRKLLRTIAERTGTMRVGSETIARQTTAANRTSSRRGAKQ